LILTDILQVIYAPKKVFKSITSNPKYLGVIIILLLFMGLEVCFEYVQFTKTSLEVTSPLAGAMQTYNNASYWTGGQDVALTNNFDDYYNNTVYIAQLQRPPNDPQGYYSLFGNNSLDIHASNTDTVIAALSNTSNVDCTANGFQNLSISLKLIQPQSAPRSAILTLYSIGDTNYYTYDLTNALSSASAFGQWGNLSILLGPDAVGWTENGNPQWTNITSLTLQFTYSSDQDINIRIGALFFRGQFIQPIQYDTTTSLLGFLQIFSLRFLFTWLVLAAIVYIICRGLKNTVLWKPLFITLGFALFVMVVRSLVNIIAALTLPVSYYPYDVQLGLGYDSFMAVSYPNTIGTLTSQSINSLASISTSLEAFRAIVSGMFLVSYVWLGGLAALALKELKPEFSTLQCLVFSAVSVAVTLLVLWFFINVV